LAASQAQHSLGGPMLTLFQNDRICLDIA
jgi:hypothetical protein